MLHFTGVFLGRVPKWSKFVLIWCENRVYLFSVGGVSNRNSAPYLLLPAEACLMM